MNVPYFWTSGRLCDFDGYDNLLIIINFINSSLINKGATDQISSPRTSTDGFGQPIRPGSRLQTASQPSTTGPPPGGRKNYEKYYTKKIFRKNIQMKKCIMIEYLE